MYCAKCKKDIQGTPLMTSDNRMFCPNCVDELSVFLTITPSNMEKVITSELLIAEGKTDEGVAACLAAAREGNPYAAINLGYYYENKGEYLCCWNDGEKKWNAFFWYDAVARGDDSYRALRGVSSTGANASVKDEVVDQALRNIYYLLSDLRGDARVRFGELFTGVAGEPHVRIKKVLDNLGKRFKQTDHEGQGSSAKLGAEDQAKIFFDKLRGGTVVIGGLKLTPDFMQKLVETADEKFAQIMVKYNFVFALEKGPWLAVMNMRDFRQKMRGAIEVQSNAYLCYQSKETQKITQRYQEGKQVLQNRKITLCAPKRFQAILERKNRTDLCDFTADDFVVAKVRGGERNSDKFLAIDFIV